RPAVTFRSKIFLTALTASAFAVAAATTLISASVRQNMEQRIEQDLAGNARMAAEMLAHRTTASDAELDAEADTLGRILSARVTFIAADGHVVGDSDLTPDELKGVENHGARPEVRDAKRLGIGSARRHSATIGTDMMYVAIPVRNPGMPTLAIVRLAVPLTDVDRQLLWVRTLSLLGFGTGIAAVLVLMWAFSVPLTRRLQSMHQRVEQYATGDLSRPAPDYTDDEVGTIARLLDRLAQDFAVRLGSLEADRARMEAILAGMIEGVLVVNEHGRLQLANEAARRMLRIDEAVGRHYPEIVRQPAVARQIANALAGKPTESVELTELRDSAAILIARTAPVEVARGRGAVVVLHDITDLRRADQIRRDFVANVSHELRTPLTAIRGYVEALGDEDADADERRRFVEIIGRHAIRMERLVMDLLRLARLDARQEALDLAPCDLQQLFHTVITDVAPTAEAK